MVWYGKVNSKMETVTIKKNGIKSAFLAVFMFLSFSVFAQDVAWKKNFGGSGNDSYESITAVSDGIIAAGYSNTLGNGDWAGVTGKGDVDAIMVKYDNAGNIMWKKNFGGSFYNYYYSVVTVPDGIVAVGTSWADDFRTSFGSGDWAGVTGKGYADAIIVKYDNAGNVVWKKNFGGSSDDYFYGMQTVSDGAVAVGFSKSGSFSNGDWTGVAGKGGNDAIIVKFTTSGTGIDNVQAENLKIYPNPASNSIFIECENCNTIRIYDMLGKEVLTQPVNGKTEINISHLPKGIYNIIILSKGEIIGNNKIVKH